MKAPSAPTKNVPKIRVGTVIAVTVRALDQDGKGLASAEGASILVAGALPGEEVRVKITSVGRRFATAETVKVLRHSPDRLVSIPCSRTGCDGCPLVLMKYSAQLAWKKKNVEAAIRSYGSLSEAVVHDVTPSPRTTGYRTSAKLVIGGKFTSPVIGIYRRNSHEIVDISDCPLHHPLINRIAAAVKTGIKKGKVPIYHERSRAGLLRYLVVRVSEHANKALVGLVTSQRSFNELHHLGKYLRETVPEVEVVVQNVNPSQGNVILGQHDYFLTTTRTISEQIGGVRFRVSPRSFFQTNRGAAEIIYEQVRQWGVTTGRESVVDLYCGVGGISLFLAPKVREVIGMEVVEAAVTDAEANAEMNGIGNCRFLSGDAGSLLRELAVRQEKIDLLVMNPPRKGCDEQVITAAAMLAPATIVYVSCFPPTLARDMDLLCAKGYRPVAVQPVDMFPQTPHVENVALLQRR